MFQNRDAAALCAYFGWLEKNIGGGQVDEVSGADKLEQLRLKTKIESSNFLWILANLF